MATKLVDVFPFIQELNWEGADDVYTPSFPQELQAIEDHLFNFESDPLFSALTRPVPSSSSSSSTNIHPFLLDLSDFYPFLPTNQPEATPTTKPPEEEEEEEEELEQEQCAAEQDVCEAFLNDHYDFSPISPNECPSSTTISPNEFPSSTTNLSDVDMLQPKTVKKHKTSVATPTREQNEEDDEDVEEEEMTTHKRGGGALNCKNLVSERNRRKRLSQQLLALRALVPNITKMDKRSVLVDALSYLRNIHEDTARLQKEIKQQQQQHPRSIGEMKESNLDNPSGTLRLPRTSPSPATPKPKPQITEIDTEKIEEKRFVVKITCRGGSGVGGDVLRVFESLDFDITYTSLQQLKPQDLLITVFIRVRKQGKMTEEKLKDCITSMALRSGIILQNP